MTESKPTYYFTEKWDSFIDLSIKRVAYGTVIGATGAFLLWSKF